MKIIVGLENADIGGQLGEGGVRQILTSADKGGWKVWLMMTPLTKKLKNGN